ncbi:MAG: stage II sporulation protein M, partial [Bacteroidota bacterium]
SDKTSLVNVLSYRYVDMTLENIEKGDPMGVYSSMSQVSMFFTITFNNVRVSFMAFGGGLFFSIGAGLLLFYNGVMLGTFQQFFYQKGLLVFSFLSIWIHGTIEISSIVNVLSYIEETTPISTDTENTSSAISISFFI